MVPRPFPSRATLAVAAVLLAALRYYGVDLTGFLRPGLGGPPKDDPDKKSGGTE